MKKQYMKPGMKVVCIQQQCIICGSDVTRNSNNAGLNEDILGGNGTARARQHSVWDDEDDRDE